MAVNKNTYGLPDETLQLIAGSPDLNFSRGTNDPGLTSMISALRGERSSNNPGVQLLANRANGAGINFNRKPTSTSTRVPILTMAKVPKTETTLPVGETQPPYVPPYVPPYLPPGVDPDPLDPDPLDPDPEDPDPEDPDPVDPTPLDPDPEDPDPLDPDPDWVDPTELDPFELDPLVYPEEPKKDRDGTVIIEEVDPNEELPQDDGTTDDILDLINSGLPGDQDDFIQDDGTTDGIQEIIDNMDGGSRGSGGGDEFEDSDFGYDFGGGGGGKYFDDQSAATIEFAKGGKVTPDRLAGPNPAGPDDGYATLKNGEFVLNKDAAKAIGYELLNRLNRSRP
jgi:hypothetical protein